MVLLALDYVARALVILALSYASIVAVTYWAVRTRRLGPFSRVSRFFRTNIDPLMAPVERRVVRAGGLKLLSY